MGRGFGSDLQNEKIGDQRAQRVFEKTVHYLVHFDFQRTQKIPSPDTTYDVACHLVTKMQTSMVEIPPNAISLAVYPDDPFLLESSHLDAAYGQEKPAKKDFPNLHVLMKNHVWVRSSAAAISGKAGVD